jgi:hypothetical protein
MGPLLGVFTRFFIPASEGTSLNPSAASSASNLYSMAAARPRCRAGARGPSGRRRRDDGGQHEGQGGAAAPRGVARRGAAPPAREADIWGLSSRGRRRPLARGRARQQTQRPGGAGPAAGAAWAARALAGAGGGRRVAASPGAKAGGRGDGGRGRSGAPCRLTIRGEFVGGRSLSQHTRWVTGREGRGGDGPSHTGAGNRGRRRARARCPCADQRVLTGERGGGGRLKAQRGAGCCGQRGHALKACSPRRRQPQEGLAPGARRPGLRPRHGDDVGTVRQQGACARARHGLLGGGGGAAAFQNPEKGAGPSARAGQAAPRCGQGRRRTAPEPAGRGARAPRAVGAAQGGAGGSQPWGSYRMQRWEGRGPAARPRGRPVAPPQPGL